MLWTLGKKNNQPGRAAITFPLNRRAQPFRHFALDNSVRLFYPSMQGEIMPPAPVPSTQRRSRCRRLFAQALELHKQGRLAEAEQLYSEVLAHRPDHFDALQMLSVIKLAKGQPAEALRLISEAMRMRRPSPQILVNHGMILHALDRSEEALASFDDALKQKSKFAEAHNNRGAVLAALGRHEEAVDCFHKALALKADYADAHYNLGSSLRVLGPIRRGVDQSRSCAVAAPRTMSKH